MMPFEIGILLHYYARVGDCDVCLANVPIWRETINRLFADGLAEHESNPDPAYPRTYRLTERGNFYVEHGLCAVPLPVQTFKIPAAGMV